MGSVLAVATVVKSMTGAGLLGLPRAFGEVGLTISGPCCVILAMLNVLGVVRLIQTKLILDRKTNDLAKIDYGSCSGATSASESSTDSANYGLGPVAVAGQKLFGNAGVVLAAVGVLGAQLGTVVAFMVFIHATLVKMVWFKDQDELMIRICSCIIYCAFSMVRKLNSLAILSVFALAAYCIVLIDLAYRGWEPITQSTNISFEDAWTIKPQGLEAWFGSTLFAFEGFVVTQYVFEDMKLTSVDKFIPIVSVGYGIGCVIFLLVGVYGYLAYGANVKVPIYLSFPQGAADTVLDELLLILILLVQFALQMFPVYSFVDSIIIRQRHSGDAINSDSDGSSEDGTADCHPRHAGGIMLQDILLRVVIVVVVYIVAVLLPNPHCVTDLVGDLFMSLIAFILPGAMHLAAHKGSLSVWGAIADIGLVVLGSVAAILGIKAAPACFASSD